MRLLILTLIVSLFIGYAEASPQPPGDDAVWHNNLGGFIDDTMRAAQAAKIEVAKAASIHQARMAGCLNVDGTIDGICMDNNQTTVTDEWQRQNGGASQEELQEGMNIVNTVATVWQDGKDYTTQVAGKISDKVSASVNAKVEPQLQKIRDLRDQIQSTWAWIKWGIAFVLFLFTVYILEPYVSLINTLLGMVGLVKRKDVLQEKVDAITVTLDAMRNQMETNAVDTRASLISIDRRLPSKPVGPL